LAVTALVRDRGRAHLPAGVDVVEGDLKAPQRLAEHLEAADAAVLVWPFFTAEGVDELVDVLTSRVRRIVYLSAQAADGRPDSFRALTERAIERSGTDWVFLRPTGFAANTLMWPIRSRATPSRTNSAGFPKARSIRGRRSSPRRRSSPPTVQQLTGRPARTFAQWAGDHAGDFR
jgi:uncharacterized protein YbjT (DUF2867 family)